MAARLSRGLQQVNRHAFARLSSRATPRVATIARSGLVPHRNTRNVAPWTGRVKQLNVARFAHTDSASAGQQEVGILDATAYKGTSITEKHWKDSDVGAVDALIEPQAVLHFVEFITSGMLPNGQKTDLSLLNADEFALFMAPSSQWAPAPYNTADIPIVQKAIQRVTGPEDLTGLCRVGHNIHFLKRRLWGGLAPVPASRWREKDLNNPEHFAIAHEYLTSVIAVFEYLNIPQIRNNMCETFNKISGDFKEMQDALNARRKERGVSAEVDLTALWEQFIRAQYEVMTSTAHSWVLAHVAELSKPTLDNFTAIKVQDAETPEMKLFTQRWTDLINVTSMADFNIWLSMDGYNGYNAPSEIVAGLHNPDLQNPELKTGFSKLLMERLTKCMQDQNELAKVQGPSALESDAARRERVSISTVVQDELRTKIRGANPSPQPPAQPWIQQLLRAQEASMSLDPSEREGYGFGLAIYRGAQNVSDEEWEKLQRNVEAHLSTWSEGVQRAEELKPMLRLHWFDGNQLGFDASKPVQEAKKHYQEIRSSEEWSHKIAPSVFLLIDHMGVGSYTDDAFTTTYAKDKQFLEGDFQGQVLAVDPDFDESAIASENADAAKEDSQQGAVTYQGRMRILGNLVWSELYPMLMLQSVGLEHLWLQAREHPLKVYTGPTVPSQVEPWKATNAIKTHMMDSFVEFLKQKDSKLAGKVKEMRKEGSL